MRQWREKLAWLLLLGLSKPTMAIDWISIYGTEPTESTKTVEFFGFTHIDYYHDSSDPNANGQFVPPKLIPPDLKAQSGFNVSQLRLGARGKPLPSDPNVNYLLRVEFGNNGITSSQGGSGKLTDLSVTFNHWAGVRVRAGLLQVIGAEESTAAGSVADYVEYTVLTNSLLLERLPNARYTANSPATDPTSSGDSLDGFDKPVAAFRDVGLQFFDTFRRDNWAFTYVAMLGNGNGLNFADNDRHKDYYGYLSAENIISGSGVKQQGVKYFAWFHNGKRSFDGDNDGVNEVYGRRRNGVGLSYRNSPWRATVEWVSAKGMLFIGPDKPSFDFNGPSTLGGSALDAKSDGMYGEVGWRILNTDWEVDARYEHVSVLKNDLYEMELNALTLGVQFHVNPKVRVLFNVTARDYEALNFPSGQGPNANLDGVGRRYGARINVAF